ncbi:MAG: hypothetical protein H0V44_12905 [Planctomycetes bacterium]|nr:hypothetical protein [Planctomycetota bacterium]
MPCLILVLALLTPRLTLFLTWLFTHYLHRAYETAIWPILGFFFMPVTTIAYAVIRNEGGGIQGLWIVLFAVAILIDIGVIGSARRGRKDGKRSS